MTTLVSPPDNPPAPPIRPHRFELHGERFSDYYSWLRDREDAAVRSYLEAENAYGRSVLDRLRGLEVQLYEEMVGRIKQTDLSVPYLDNGHWYYDRTLEGQQ